MLRSFVLFILSMILLTQASTAQSIIHPQDPIVDYDSLNPPAVPPVGQIHKWVRTPRLIWNTSDFKSYIYNGIQFRVKFPKTYDPNASDGKKYPMLMFFHGFMEGGTVYDNEFQLYLGGSFFQSSVNDGTYDGYVIALQSNGGFFGGGHYQSLKDIMDYMVQNNKLDPFSVVANGLSAGGTAVWDMAIQYPTYVAGGLPMSATSILLINTNTINTTKFTPIWHQQGGLDNNPAPSTTQQVKDAMDAAGANFTNRLFPTLGHDTWTATWNDTTFWNFIKRAYAANPWPLFGRSEFCSGDPIQVTIGLAPGFQTYEWRKNGVLMPGATTNTIQVTDLGLYSARVQRDGIWSEWSRIPVEIKIKQPTITPDIKVSGLASRVIPSLDGSTSVTLEVPEGYTSYDWQLEGNNTTISNTRFLAVNTPGDYKVKVSEQYSCSSEFSPLFKVVNANGPNKPDAATNLIATTLSNAAIRLDWTQNPTPQYNETNFEVFMSTQPGGPYAFMGMSGADATTYSVTGLIPNAAYYFRIRAVNLTGASLPSNESGSTTLSDNQPPTAPVLSINYVTSNSVALTWTASTDDGGIQNYEVYVNGSKSYVTTGTQFLVTSLQTGSSYNFRVKSKDLAGNLSAFSNQVTAVPTRGLNFKYYTYTGGMAYLPDFNSLSPVATGNVPNVTLANRTQDDQFAFLWEGYIIIPQTGTYYFRTRSDEGSKVFLGSLSGTSSPYSVSGPAIVNNDGAHLPTTITSQGIHLEQGVYPIAIAYFEYVGGETMELTWRTPMSGFEFETIPNQQFTDQPVAIVARPAKPTNLAAAAVSHNKIQLTWNDNSNNETGFEIFRSVKPLTNFISVGIAGADMLTYTDSSLNASTRYYYRIMSFNANGESDFDLAGQGVDYSYYEIDNLGNLPDFAPLTPVKSGRTNNFNVGLQDRADNFQFKFSTTIHVPVTGAYTFYLTSDDGSKLYINGLQPSNLVIDHDGWHGPTEKTGAINLTKGAHTLYVLYLEAYGDEVLNVKFSAPGIQKQNIPDEMLGTLFASAATWANPATPVRPVNLVASGISSTAVQLNWQDKSSNETGFEIFRSAANNSSYILYTTVAANSNSFTDTDLFANAVYYYKVRAKGSTTNSGFSNEDSAKVWNRNPVITDIPNRTARFGQQTIILLTASDADNDVLNFSGQNLPAFATVTNNGNGSASLVLNPSNLQQGVYNQVRIIVKDPHGGGDTTTFNLTINDNYDPVISVVSNQVMTEGDVLQLSLAATDQNPGDVISLSVNGISFSHSISATVNGNATLTLSPDLSAAGSYVVTVIAADGNNGYGTTQFNLDVLDAAPGAPSDLTGQFVFGQGVVLNWQDNASNETGFQIYRSASLNGSYVSVGSAGANIETFTDNSVTGNTNYYYKIRAVNAVDVSSYSNSVLVFTNRIPQLAAVANVFLKTNESTIVNLTATDDAGDQLVISATGLPSFATLTDNGNGTASISIVPNISSPGVYAVTLKVKDNFDSSSSVQFTITVSDKDVNSVYLNFTSNDHIAGAPWNNLVNANGAGTVFTGLVDEKGTSSGISITMQDGWAQTTTEGIRSNTGREIYPVTVTRTAIAETGTSRRLVVNGLNTSGTRYNLVFFNSFDHDRNTETQFTINGQTVTLNGKYNGTNTVQVNGIVPDVNGKVNIDIIKGSGAEKAILNAMVIQSYASSITVLSPAGTRVADAGTNYISIAWQDRSDNEAATSGFEIWRADDTNASFGLIGSVNANTTLYKDQTVSQGRTYYYSIRAKTAGTIYSSFSNVATGAPYVYSVYINFNQTNPAGSPWNNTNAAPQEGLELNALKDATGQATSLSLVQSSSWSGIYPGGVDNTGNTGIFPDAVMKESFGLFPGVSGKIRIRGLNMSMKYNLSFFASAAITGDVNVAYTVGSKTVMLNTALNRSGLVTMYDVSADANGEINITVAPGTGTSQFGLLGALIIEGYHPSAAIAPLPAGKQQEATVALSGNQGVKMLQLNVHPNPFQQSFVLSVETGIQEVLDIAMYDMSGKMIHQQQYRHLRAGWNPIRIQPSNGLPRGVYLIKVTTADGNTGSLRVIKN